MTQVVDASAVVAVLLDAGGDGQWCADRLARGGLVAPHLMPFEVANVVRRMVARGVIESAEGSTAMRDLTRLEVEVVPFEPLAPRVWELRDELTSYDASYVAVAELLGAPLLTLDNRLAGAASARCPILTPPD